MNTPVLENILVNFRDTDECTGWIRQDRNTTARWCSPEEGKLLTVNMRLVEEAYECGTANGYSTSWLALAGPKVIHTYDPVDRPKVWNNEQLEALGKYIEYHQQPFSELEIASDRGSALFFIDGDHSSSAIAEDMHTVEKHMQAGDIIIVHDLNITPVAREWARFVGRIKDTSSVITEADTAHIVGVVHLGSK